MKILHTSDWHIGKVLYGKKRYREFEEFLTWMQQTIAEQNIDILLISGDIFDTTAPSNRAVELYFNFLYSVAKDGVCKHIVITAGNHDSPSFLEAPKEILKFLNIYIVANIDIKEEVIKLKVDDKEIIICAVPYLRDRDLRDSKFGESIEDKEQKIVSAIVNHYKEVAEYAKSMQKEGEPIIAMGHLFVRGSNTKIGDGVRELYVGSLGYVGSDIFDDAFDYVALGHLHIPQNVGGKDNIRYSGSPLAMGFNEAKQQKSVTILDFNDGLKILTIDVPKFQELEQIVGDLDFIKSRLKELIKEDRDIWVEIIYNGDEVVGNLNAIVNDLIKGSKIEVLRVKTKNFNTKSLMKSSAKESLQELDEYEVFDRCLEYNEVSLEQRDELRTLYKDIISSLFLGSGD